MITINISNQQTALKIDEQQIRAAVQQVMSLASRGNATINLAIVDDPTIHDMNLRFLNHDYPTDVISFVMEENAEILEGDVIVSADTAVEVARDLSWIADHELLLYIVHGCLHLVGYDDTTAEAALEMRNAEKKVLKHFNIIPPWDEKSQFGAHVAEGD